MTKPVAYLLGTLTTPLCYAACRVAVPFLLGRPVRVL